MSARQLAERLGVWPQTLTRWEDGTTRPALPQRTLALALWAIDHGAPWWNVEEELIGGNGNEGSNDAGDQ
jgi:transcriptional regulator with XRE-family HTH domain